MPNWCENILTVEGAPDEVQKFRNENTFVEVGEQYHMAAGESRVLPLSFSALLPTPLNPDGTLIGEGQRPVTARAPDWYDWRVKNWGTKWDLCDQTDVSTTPGWIEYRFDTAWSPPVEWLTHVADLYPNLSFEIDYEEWGMAFWGSMRYENGEQVDVQEGQIDYDEDTETFERV